MPDTKKTSVSETAFPDDVVSMEQLAKENKIRGQFSEILHRLRQNRAAMIGLAILILILATSVISGFVLDYDTQVIAQNRRARYQPPSMEHICGTDKLGRDVFIRILYGSRFTLSVSFSAVALALVIGVTLGAVAGYFSGTVEEVIMRFTDIFGAVPSMLMAIVIVQVLGQSSISLQLAIGLTSVPQFVRITRASVLTVRNQDYIEASRALGLSNFKIIFQHILPNCLSPIIVQTTLRMATAIISVSSLSYLGLGVQPPAPEWGAMLAEGREAIRKCPYLTLFPGIAIMITVLSLNLLGDGLRDALDPKLKK